MKYVITAGPALALGIAALVGMSLVGVLEPAFAQTAAAPVTGAVVIPWGDWLAPALASIRDASVAGLVALISWAVAKFIPQAQGFLEAARVEQLIGRAVDFGIASAGGAVHGKAATIPVANAVLEQALNYAIQAAPALAEKLADTLRPKIIARIAAAGLVPAAAAVTPTPATASFVATPAA
jgi:hypothetical protein